MATSGTITYALNARQVITEALQEIRVTGVAGTPSAEDMAAGMRALNRMLKSWQLSGPSLWLQTEGSVTITASTASFPLSPVPHTIIECRYRDANGRDLPMLELTRSEYLEMPLKTTQGVPTQYYFDNQRATKLLYIWPVMGAPTTETIKYTYQRITEDVTNESQNLDIPQEYMDLVVTCLADRLLTPYGKTNKDLSMRAREMLFEANAADREDYVRFVPDLRR